VNKFYGCVPLTVKMTMSDLTTKKTETQYVSGDQDVTSLRERLQKRFKVPLEQLSLQFVRNHIKRITITGATSGTFTLTFDTKVATVTFDSDQAQQKLRLEAALAVALGSGDAFVVTKDGAVAGVFLITLLGQYAGQANGAMTANAGGLLPLNTNPAVAVDQDVQVGGPKLEVQTVTYTGSPNQGTYTLQLGTWIASKAIQFNGDGDAIKAAITDKSFAGRQPTDVTAKTLSPTSFEMSFGPRSGQDVYTPMTVVKTGWGNGDVVTAQTTKGEKPVWDYPWTQDISAVMNGLPLTAKAEYSIVAEEMYAKCTISKSPLSKPMYFNIRWPVIVFRAYIKLVTGIDAGVDATGPKLTVAGREITTDWSVGMISDGDTVVVA